MTSGPSTLVATSPPKRPDARAPSRPRRLPTRQGRRAGKERIERVPDGRFAFYATVTRRWNRRTP